MVVSVKESFPVSTLKEEHPPPPKKGHSKIHFLWTKVNTNKLLFCSPKVSVTHFLTSFQSGHDFCLENCLSYQILAVSFVIFKFSLFSAVLGLISRGQPATGFLFCIQSSVFALCLILRSAKRAAHESVLFKTIKNQWNGKKMLQASWARPTNSVYIPARRNIHYSKFKSHLTGKIFCQ